MSAPIRPSDVDTSVHFWDSFGHSETEVSARLIVKFCAERDDTWAPFTHAEISERTGEHFHFNRLVGTHGVVGEGDVFVEVRSVKTGWKVIEDWLTAAEVTLSAEGLEFHVTDEFIRVCFKAAGKASR